MSYRPALAAGVLLFVTVGCLFIPYAGIHADECIFVSGIYGRNGLADKIQIRTPVLKVEAPLMLMSYLGACKSWAYALILKALPPSAETVRIPVVLLTGLTIYLFGLLLYRLEGPNSCTIGCTLLATDPTFLLTSVFDWGPVALQHFLLIGGLFAVQAFYHNGRSRWLALAGLLFGLAMWDKALFIWLLSAGGLGAVLIFPRELRRWLTPKTGAAFLAAFVTGSFPLILYNIRQPFATFRQDTTLSIANLQGKEEMLRLTFAGTGLMSYLVRIDPEGHPRAPAGVLETGSVAVDQALPGERQSYLLLAAALCLALAPVWWSSPRRRLLLLTLFTFGVGWLEMAVSKSTGGSVHHTILLWPLPELFVAIVLAEIWRRFRYAPALVAALVAGLAATNLLTLNQHLARLIVNGPTVVWTDALYPLHRYLEALQPRGIVTMDWGIHDPLKLLSRGKLPLRVGEDPLLKPQLTGQEKQEVISWLTPENVFVSHTDGNEQFPGINQHLRDIAEPVGFVRKPLTFIKDRNGRAIFEVFRYVREPARPSAPGTTLGR